MPFFVNVYPIKRLPRRFGAFTYVVLDETASEVIRGSFVIIPWRSGSVRGIVSEVHARKPEGETKLVSELMTMRLSESELCVYERVAEETFQSVSSVLAAAFPTPSRNLAKKSTSSGASSGAGMAKLSSSVSRRTLSEFEMFAKNPPPFAFVATDDLVDTALLVRLLAKRWQGSLLFLVPHFHDLKIAAELLTTWGLEPSLCASDLTELQRHDLARAWRKGEIPLLLSTRLGSLFLPPDHLSAIVVGRSGVEEHAQYDHNPRYDARRLAQAWSQVRGCPLILCDTLPLPPEIVCDCRQISRVYGSKFRRQSPTAPKEPFGKIITPQARVGFGDDPLPPEPLTTAIGETVKQDKRVLFICNQKGLGARLECGQCKFTELCASCKKPLAVYETHLFCAACKRTTKRPDACRKCRSDKLKTVRRGTGSLEKLLKARFHGTSVAVIEKGGTPSVLNAQIIVATSYYYENLYRPHQDVFGLVALPCADQEVRLEQSLARVSRRLLEYQGIAKRNRCPFIVQTWDPSLLHHLLYDGETVLEKECQARKELGQSPFVCEIELLARGKAGFRELDKTLAEAGKAEKTTLAKLSPARWKILTDSANLLQKLKATDDYLIISNKT